MASLNVLAWSTLGLGFFGVSALVSVAVVVLVFAVGIRRRPRQVRRIVWWGLGGAATAALLAIARFGAAATSLREAHDLLCSPWASPA